MSTLPQYPKYGTTTPLATWRVGSLGDGGDAGSYSGISGTNDAWCLWTLPLPTLKAGTYYLNKLQASISLCSSAHCDKIYFGLLAGSESAVQLTTFSTGLDYVDVTASRADTTAHQVIAPLLGDLAVTLEDGVLYYAVIGMHGINGRTSGYPGVKRLNTNVGPQVNHWRSVNSTQAAWSATGLELRTGADIAHPRMEVWLKTANRIVYETDYSTAKKFYVPRRNDADGWIKFEDAVVADGQALTCKLDAEASADATTRTTLVLNMGATDQVTFGGANVALAAAGAEAGDTFEMGINLRPANKMDLFYQNRTTGQGAQSAATDLVTISHACKNASARDAEYTVSFPNWLDLSGTATVSKIQVGWEPLLIFGDSQVANFTTPLPTAFTHDRMYFNAGIGGNLLTQNYVGNSTAGYLRYKHTTPGLGDLCEMTGVVFVYMGFGVNDIANITTTEAQRNKTMADISYRLGEILSNSINNGNHPIIVGLPPYSNDAGASEQEAWTIKTQLNPMLEGLALGVRCAYVNPWWAMVQSNTSEDAVPQFNPAYCDAQEVHYNAVGAAIVAQKIAEAYELGIVGGWWSRNRRLIRQSGSLFPI